MSVQLFDPRGRYGGIPGQSLFAPILNQPELGMGGLDDSTGGMDASNQTQVDAIPDPDPIPPAQQMAMAPPPAPSGNPAAYNRAAGLPPVGMGGMSLAAPPKPPLPSDYDAPNLPPGSDTDNTPNPPDSPPPPPPPNGSTVQAPDGSTLLLSSNDVPAPPLTTMQKRQDLAVPQPSNPKWYQRLAAAALGGAEGYVNASGQGIRIPQSEIAAGGQAILHPGYSRQMQQYGQQRTDLDDKLIREAEQKREADLDEVRRENAETLRQTAADRLKKQTDDTAEKALESKRKTFLALKGNQAPAYQDASAPVPPGYTALNDPDAPGQVAVVRNGIQPAPKELIERQYLFGYKPGDPVDLNTLKAAYDAYYKDTRPANKPNANEWQVYLDASDGDAAQALVKWKADKISIATASRAPKEPSATQLTAEHRATVRQLAQKAMNQSRANGGPGYEDAIRNVQQFYQGDDAMTDNRDDVIAQLNQWKVFGLRPEQVQGSIDRSNTRGAFTKLVKGALAGGPPPAPVQKPTPGAPAPRAAAAPPNAPAIAGQTKYLANGQAVKITKVYANGRVDYAPVAPIK